METLPEYELHIFMEAIYVRYKAPLLGVMRGMIGAPDDCEDLLHDLFVRMLAKAALLYTLARHELESYLFQAARGVAVDYLRRRGKHLYLSDDVLLAQTGRQCLAVKLPLRNELLMLLGEAAPETQVLLIGKYYFGLSTKELSDLTGCHSSTQRSKLSRACKRLLYQWQADGICIQDFLEE